MKTLPGYLHEIWMSPDENNDGEYLASCIALGPSGDRARALLETGSYCVLVFWASCHNEAMQFYYSFLGYGTYTSDQDWDYQEYPIEWHEEQRSYLCAL